MNVDQSDMDLNNTNDRYHMSCAEGWLELGDLAEAEKELEKISPDIVDQPDCLEIRWLIYEERNAWEQALEVAERLIKLAPERPSGWIHRSYCLHELRQTDAARDHLMEVINRFPDIPTIPYNLACYACRLGQIDKAVEWLETACSKGDAGSIRQMARKDPDLKPMWKMIDENLC